MASEGAVTPLNSIIRSNHGFSLEIERLVKLQQDEAHVPSCASCTPSSQAEDSSGPDTLKSVLQGIFESISQV